MSDNIENAVAIKEAAPSKAKPTRKDLNKIFDSIFSVAGKKVVINASKGKQDVVITECIRLLAETGLVFDRGGLVGIDAEDSIHPFTSATVRIAVSKLAHFIEDKHADGRTFQVAADIPAYVGHIAQLSRWDDVPVVDSITDHPVITPDNRLVSAGFDSETKIFGRFDETDFHIPESPTMEEAHAAITEMTRLLQTFEFDDQHDFAAALTGFLTAVSRPVLPTAPLVLLDAPDSGAGKGYLGGLMARIAFRKTPNSKQLPDDPDEIHKAIVSALMSAQPVIFFDELATNELDCPAIRTLASAEVYSARLLGVMREVNLSTRALVLCTGNNISPTADTSRRILHIRLNPACETPSARVFKFDAAAEMFKHRNHFVSLLLTIQRAYLLAHARGEVKQPEQAIGGFKDWDLMCRRPIFELLGIDPCQRMLDSMRNNPRKTDLLAVMVAWKEEFGFNLKMSAGGALREIKFAGVAGEVVNRRPNTPLSAKSFGFWLNKHKDQVVEGMLFAVAGTTHGSVQWVLLQNSRAG